jgi:DNA-binding LacI/PurR family transcriptional regulator
MQEHVQLRTALHDLVSATAAAGERELPSLRDLAAQFEVSPNTIKKFLLELDGEVEVFPVHGRGFFLRLPGDPEPGLHFGEGEAEESTDIEPEEDPAPLRVDERYSPVPEEGRAARRERRSGRDTVVVVGQILRATDPTGAPSNRFSRSMQVRESLQSMGFQLAWAPIGYDRQGRLSPTEVKSLQLQLASLGDRLAGILLLDAGFGKEQPLWELAVEATGQPVVWFQTSPLPEDGLPEPRPSNVHVLEPDWEGCGRTLAAHLLTHHKPQKVLILPAPGERGLPPHLESFRETMLEAWGPRWLTTLEWYDVFPQGLPKDPARSLAGKLRRLLLDTGLTRYELDRYFASARTLGAPLWVCADDLLALAAIDHFEARHLPNEPRPGVLGFGNHPFSLARGLCTVDPAWSALVERAIELFTGYGRRNRTVVHRVIEAPSESVYGGNILGRNEEWW